MRIFKSLPIAPGLKAVATDKQLVKQFMDFHSRRVYSELRASGADAYDLSLPETHYLPRIIHPDEHIKGSVYGKFTGGRGVLVVTDRRVLFINKKPFFVDNEELSFAVIGGVSHTQVGPIGTVTLHTRVGDFKLRTFNQKNALNFADSVERACLEEKSQNHSEL